MFNSEAEAACDAAGRAGLGKGTTVVDNDLISVAFMGGAGIALGFILQALDTEPDLGDEVAKALFSFLSLCLEAGNDAA
jgi:hypothetical protein